MMIGRYKELIKILGQNRVLIDEPLSKYTSFHLGGKGDLLFKAKTQNELLKAILSARKLKIPYFLLGGGTNLLISDSGLRGIVIKNETNIIKIVSIRGDRRGSQGSDKSPKVHTIFIESESGVSVNRLVRFTLDQGLSGFEAFLGQPGSVGGAVWINAHNMKMGKFFTEAIFAVKLLGRSGKISEAGRSYFKFGYDQSIIQKTNEIVLSVVFKLEKGARESLWKSAHEALAYRRENQPENAFSAGCIFRNIAKSDAMRIATPDYACSAGFLLDSLKLKGVAVGQASFSCRHANFIIHKGAAKASDVVELIKLAKRKVREKYNIKLEEEIKLIGKF